MSNDMIDCDLRFLLSDQHFHTCDHAAIRLLDSISICIHLSYESPTSSSFLLFHGLPLIPKSDFHKTILSRCLCLRKSHFFIKFCCLFYQRFSFNFLIHSFILVLFLKAPLRFPFYITNYDLNLLNVRCY
jgi:hypothetical protein